MNNLEHHLYNLDLTNEQLKTAGIVSFVGLLMIFFTSRLFLKEAKQQAWVISATSSFILSTASIIYLYAKGSGLITGLSDLSFATKLFHNVDNFTMLICLYFAVANVTDLLIGVIFYPKYVGLLTGFIHHAIYTWMMIICTTGNGYFTTSRPFASLFIFCAIEEIPTFLLALGSINPIFRTDLGFGITFFLTRIVFHLFMMMYCFYSNVDVPVIALYVLTLTMHINWFYNWASKYGKDMLKKGKEGKEIKKKE